jgi:hypothetical protein
MVRAPGDFYPALIARIHPPICFAGAKRRGDAFSASIKVFGIRSMAAKQTDNFSEQFRCNAFWQALIAILGFLVSIRMFYPGLMSNDSVDQYSQALRFSFHDWHPPLMAFVWALINDWIPGPLGMLMLFCGLYWGALFLLSLSVSHYGKRYAIAFLVLGFAPWAIGNLGAIWKDVFHAVLTLFAVGLAILAVGDGKQRRSKLGLAALVLLLIAAMVRFNALVALPPLLWLFIGRPRLTNWKTLAVLAVVPMLVLVLSSVFTYGFLRAERTGAHSSLLIYDIGAISNATGINAFGQSFGPENEQKLTSTCYDTSEWDTYAWGSCSFVTPAIKASGLWGSEALTRAWVQAIRNHPAEYVKHRFSHWWNLLWKPKNLLLSNMQSNSWGFEFTKSALHLTLERFTDIMGDVPFYRPGAWLIFALVLVAVAARRGAGPARDIVIALNVSAVLYLLSYLPIGVASDFRYAYWSILASWFSLPLLRIAIRQARSAPPSDRQQDSASLVNAL